MAHDLPYRLIVFDWDGTLMDSIATIVACADHARRDVGAEQEGFDRLIREGIGLGLDALVARILPAADATLRGAWVERYRFRWLESYRDRSFLLQGAQDAIEQLAVAGYWLAIATGKGRTGLDRDLDTCGLRPRFLATRTVNESPGKPDPAMLLEILDELGVDRRQALMVGDTTFDLDMAANAGVDSVAVLSGSHDCPTLLARGPKACLTGVHELPLWLAGRLATQGAPA
jgi:phosphoglycolate phosphatase